MFSDEEIKKFNQGFDRSSDDECWNWRKGHSSNGYGVLYLSNKKPITAHRMALSLKIGQIPEGLFALHSCDNRSCVNPSHLRAGTNTDNARDAVSRGRNSPPPRSGVKHGEKNHLSKLTEAQVKQIIELRAAGWSLIEVANRFSVHHGTVAAICSGRSWRYIFELPGVPPLSEVRGRKSTNVKGSPLQI